MRLAAASSLTVDREKDEALYSVLFGDCALAPELGIRVKDPGVIFGNSSATVTLFRTGVGSVCILMHRDIAPTNILYACAASVAHTPADAVNSALKEEAKALATIRQKLAGFTKLAENWDAEGGRAISAETLRTAERVLEHIELILSRKNILSSPSVRPSPDGSVTFKWIQGQKELDLVVTGQAVDAQRWHPLESYESEGLWEISVDDTPEQIEWVLTQ
jgi:hypothetical protein